jgi:dephospho-CoA kinase
MITIGITGGIGAGKSYVSECLVRKGYRLYNSDLAARHLINTDPEVKQAIQSEFGTSIYQADGNLNRKLLAEKVFQNPSALEKLNAIVHPATIYDFKVWKETIPVSYPYLFQFKEAAILFESGTYLNLDRIILVYAPLTLRLKRVIERDQISMDTILQRVQHQWSDTKKIIQSNDIIFNDEIHNLIPQIEFLLNKYDQFFNPLIKI